MRYGEDWWTPEEAEDGLISHNAVFDPISGVYREVVDNDEWQEPTPTSVPARSRHTREEGTDGDEDL